MKQVFLIQENKTDKITFYHLIAFVATLPYDRLYSELALVSLLIHTLIHLRKTSFKNIELPQVLIACSVYLLTLVATFYTHYRDEAFSEWERQLALLLFPLIVSLSSFDFRRYFFNILMALSFSCAGTILYLYVTACKIISYNHLPYSSLFSNAFINHNFAAPIDMHATYFSMYIALAAVGVMYAFVDARSRFSKFLYAFVFLVLVAGLVQLSSRAVLISFAVIINLIVPFFKIDQGKRTAFITVSVLATFTVFFVFAKIENIKTRFTVDLKEDLSQTDIINNQFEPRAIRWYAAKELILSSPVYGHGSGSEIPLLKDVYYKQRLYNSFLNSLNIHNQYLSMLIKTGLIGLMIWLFVLIAGFRRAIQSRDGIFFAFLVIIATVSFSENILDGNKGIFFFACFYSLFYLGKRGAGCLLTNNTIRR